MTGLLLDDLDATDEETAQDWFRERGMTDGLPIIVPTVERVEAFLDAAGFDRDRAVGAIEPANGYGTVENVAVNALMAGCKPAHLGVVLAAVEAMTKPRFNLRGVQTTTNPVAPLTIVSGPIRHGLGIDSGGHAFSGGPHPNLAIGRAIRFVLRNIGGADNDVSQSTIALPARIAFCIAENEEASPWEPHHVSIGYDTADSVVTTIAVESIIDVVSHMWTEAEPTIKQYVDTMRAVGSNVLMGEGSVTWVLSPARARFFAARGYSRQDLQERLFEDTKFLPEEWPFAVPEANTRAGGYEGAHGWVPEEGKLRIADEPSDIVIIVAGRDEPIHSSYMTPMCFSDWTSAEVWAPGPRRTTDIER